MVCGPRHFDGVMWAQILGMTFEEFMRLQRINGLPPPSDRVVDWQAAEQGFIDQRGTFLTREEAWDVAEKAGQIIVNDSTRRGVLHSEDLW